MEQATKDTNYAKSKILTLPFINAPPTDYSTIYTSLLFAVSKSNSCNQATTIVSFDQPLYWKARDIVATAFSNSSPKSIVIRLGGYHLLMSYLGAVGYIMDGSGLADALKVIYAENSVEKMLQGHAYSRAVRAHFLVYVTLAKIIMDLIDLTDDERDKIESYVSNFDGSAIFTAQKDVIV